ncbi:variant chaperonin GroEL3 [Chlamydia sp. 17-3921]|uniref:variant chaperonin GroEL3 n=1 Tax=Chlamydia sp. 17-3921 TaxID=2675798 RepID=UPI0019198244|nr:variant chaperonin GroEL3 [Chlamydia sp. 17-3921]
MSDQGKLSHHNANPKLFLGIDKACDLVRKFYGPRHNLSSLAFLEERGYSILSQTELEDPYENAGVGFAKAMANKIHKKHFDGTTTGLILLHTILKESYKALGEGFSTLKLSQALQKKISQLLEILNTYSWPIKDAKKVQCLIFTALRSPIIADDLAEAFAITGTIGLISITKNYQLEMQTTQGLKIDFGFTSAYFASDPITRTTTILFPRILILDQKITNIHILLPLLQDISQRDKHLLIFCEDIDKDVLATLIVNKLRGLLQVSVITIPGLSTDKQTLAEDIALFTGTHIYSQNMDLNTTILGSCSSVEISETQTTLIGGQHVPEVLTLKVRQLEEEIRTTASLEAKSTLIERMQRLQCSVALLSVKENTEPLYRLGLTLIASATKHGYIPGGGVALLYASLDLGNPKDFPEEERAATYILQAACKAPLEQLILNANLDSNAIIEKLKTLATVSMGFNILSQEIEDLISGGVLDSLATISTALSCAMDTALMILSSKTIE